MFGGGNKRTRQTRTISVRGPETVWSKAAELSRDRGFLLRLGLCLSAIVLVLLLVQSWKAPFPYRVGQREPQVVRPPIAQQQRRAVVAPAEQLGGVVGDRHARRAGRRVDDADLCVGTGSDQQGEEGAEHAPTLGRQRVRGSQFTQKRYDVVDRRVIAYL